ncbi:eukaryotic initiation factor-2b gamma [Cystoisospora suis]|uniref:Translation initiation factor eIF2B subunit gamma n=1 Tax=Cystoisospora suis TaxID=483139 RepID=A0A2C6LDV7_9APIC|nr:eukaryotic initiation factor-2b gamma [Cystoisospora suis]
MTASASGPPPQPGASGGGSAGSVHPAYSSSSLGLSKAVSTGAGGTARSGRDASPFLEFQVVVLAGGVSSRLSSVMGQGGRGKGSVYCKALLPVGNRPMLWYLLKNLQEARFGDVIIVTEQCMQAELSSFLRSEFNSAFQRLEVVGLRKDRKRPTCTTRSSSSSSSPPLHKREDFEKEGEGGAGLAEGKTGRAPPSKHGVEKEDEKIDVEDRHEEEEEDDGDRDICGTAEALLEILPLITTDFFVMPCDVIGNVDFFALANIHRIENAACSVYLLQRDYLSVGPSDAFEEKNKKGGGGKKPKQGGGLDKRVLFDATKGNPVSVAYDEKNSQLLAIQDGHSIVHGGAKLCIPKLSLFYHPSLVVQSNLYDPHIYLFKHATLRILQNSKLRNSLTSIRYDFVPFLTTMQLSPYAEEWSGSRLDCDVFDELLEALDEPPSSPPAGHSGVDGSKRLTDSTATSYKNHTGKGGEGGDGRHIVYTLANRPPKPRKGNRVVFAKHPESAGVCCRVNNLHDYYEMNMKFCVHRIDELRQTMPEWMFPIQNAKRPPNTRDSVIGEGVVFEETAMVKHSVVGSEVRIGSKTKVTASILMYYASIQEDCTIQRCIIGKRSVISKGCKLTNCQIRHGYTVPPGTVAEDETLPSLLDDLDGL